VQGLKLQLKSAKSMSDKRSIQETKQKVQMLISDLKDSLGGIGEQLNIENAECVAEINMHKQSF
jgi:hypothetical protein